MQNDYQEINNALTGKLTSLEPGSRHCASNQKGVSFKGKFNPSSLNGRY
jgi:hypothetical protein